MENSGLGLISRLTEPKQQIPEDRKRFSDAALKGLIIPIIIEQFLALLVGIADTLMVSYVGEAAVSSVSLVNQLNNVFIMVFTALASGGAVVASQYMGKRDYKNGTQAARTDFHYYDGGSVIMGTADFWRFIWQGRAGCTGFGTGVSAHISIFFSLFGCV